MKHLILTACLVLFIADHGAFGAASNRSFSGGRLLLSIDGVSCGAIYSVDGGDPRGNVVVQKAAASGPAKKTLGSISYDPITIVVTLPLAQPLADWIGDLCANRKPTKTLIVTETDFNNIPKATLESFNTVLTEVRVPTIDAASKDPGRITLVFSPETTRTAAASGPALSTLPASAKNWLASNFKVQIGTLPTTRVAKVDAFTIKLSSGDSNAGVARAAMKDPGNVEFHNLVVTASMIDVDAWTTWRDDFIINGKNSDSNELSGALSFLAVDKSALLTFQLSQIGIVSLVPIRGVAGSDSIAQFKAELYVEGVLLPPSGGATKSPGKSEDATKKTQATEETKAASSKTEEAGDASKTKDDKSGAASADNVNGPSQGGAVDSPGTKDAGAGTKSGGSVAGKPEDQGARDPANFPRPDGTIRKSYTGIRQKTTNQEIAGYSSTESLDALEEIYTKNLTSTGWELITRQENNFGIGGRHQIILNLKNALRSVTVTLTDFKEGNSDIVVNLTTGTPK